MKSAQWRRYRGHSIVATKAPLLGSRYQVWDGTERIGTFSSLVRAELSIDARLRSGESAIPVAGAAEPTASRDH